MVEASKTNTIHERYSLETMYTDMYSFVLKEVLYCKEVLYKHTAVEFTWLSRLKAKSK
jgi:hypothetical protein